MSDEDKEAKIYIIKRIKKYTVKLVTIINQNLTMAF